MLSINIPVYNIEVVRLVKQLVLQAEALKIQYEIRVYDDGSDDIFKSINKNLVEIPNVVYFELDKNLGRSAIRNKMGVESAYDLLLFMDADSKVVNNDYLHKYIEHFKTGTVLCGGRSYSPIKPRDVEKIFHWTYGKQREAISASKRMRNKGVFFMSNNFILEKGTFEHVHFREEIQKYGHEDTLFGYDLFCKGYSIVHIDNPLEHTGIENSSVFLKKSKLALDNLKLIEENLLLGDSDFRENVNFLRKYYKITHWFPAGLVISFFVKYSHKVEQNLQGKSPSLFLFDLYKVGYFTLIKNR